MKLLSEDDCSKLRTYLDKLHFSKEQANKMIEKMDGELAESNSYSRKLLEGAKIITESTDIHDYIVDRLKRKL